MAGSRRRFDASRAVAEAMRDGFVRIVADGRHLLLEDVRPEDLAAARRIDVVVDRIVARDGMRTRLADSVELAMNRSGGEIRVLLRRPGEDEGVVLDESSRMLCPECHVVFEKLSPASFSFNSPRGACPECDGLGRGADGGPCPSCGGRRLAPAPCACRLELGEKPFLSLPEVLALDVSAAVAWAESARRGIPANLRKAVLPVFDGLLSRLSFLRKAGLGYLSLDRPADTLSSGEARRVRLAGALGQDLSGALYVLDEPTAGLHPRDTAAVVSLLGRLRDGGNTLVVVEHDQSVMRAADWIVEMGPGAGSLGGRVVYQGPAAGLADCAESPTGGFLSGREGFHRPVRMEPGSRGGFIEVRGACANNLARVSAHFPIGCMTAVSGVSGSGKTSLVEEVLGANLSAVLSPAGRGRPGPVRGKWKHCDSICGFGPIRRVVEVGRAMRAGSPRSVVATACGAFDRIRALFAATPLARSRGYTASRFSFSAKGGRCEECKGDGEIALEMAFLPDGAAVCETCGGTRYNRETLDVHWSGRSIADVLAMDVDGAAEVFRPVPALARLFDSLKALGLGYLSLGQRVSTLSGGEAQRLLLASELSAASCSGTLFILDEPAAGQHARDVNALLRTLEALRDAGGTVVLAEHRPQVLAAMDWIVDMGPGAGRNGGTVVAEGSPEAVARSGSPTAPFLS